MEDEEFEEVSLDKIREKEEYDDYDEENIEFYQEREENNEEIEDDDNSLSQPEKIKANKIFIFKSDQGKVGKNYFNEEYVKNLILEYQKTLVTDGDKIVGNKLLEYKIMAELEKLALAIINKYAQWRFCPIEDLMQECLKVAFQNIPKFNAEYIVDENTKRKTSVFNFFSLIFKMHLYSFTLKGKKHRDNADVDVFYDVVEERSSVNYNIFFGDLEKTLFRIINENYLREKRKKYIELASILVEYLVKTKSFVGKNDMLAWFRGYGFKSSDVKDFTNEMHKYKEIIYSII
ncbi:MAG: hypothetical protein LBF97_05590 [Elusimicrobiota bacterium]|jgi:hypothetical protein|nr:hypothetical protein [Elusimicrobiota bacterium]